MPDRDTGEGAASQRTRKRDPTPSRAPRHFDPSGDRLPADLARALELGGETGELIANYDWGSHPLGPMSEWSPTVRAVVSTALSSRFPIVLWLGRELSILYNDAYIPMLGAKHSEALGLAGRDVWWEIWDVIGPMLEGVVDSGVATWSDNQLLMLFREGYLEEAYFTFTYSPIVEADGSVAGVFCAVNETTERELSERRLEALRDMAECLSDPPSVAFAADAALQCTQRHHADVRFLAVYLRTDDGPTLHGATENIALPAATVAQRLEGWGPVNLASMATTSIDEVPEALRPEAMSGETRASRALVLPLVDAAISTPMGWLVIGLNPHRRFDDAYRTFCELLAGQVAIAFTNAVAHEHERERVEALAELDQAKTAFFGNVSHEFRTPLTLMLGPLEELAAETTHTHDGIHERVEMVERNARRLLRLVNSLLEFSRVEAGRASASFTETDLGEYTADLVATFRAACERAGLDLEVEAEPVVAYVDRAMWETIVLNLVSNAFKFTFDGAITVRVAASADEAVVTVTDTGVGIAPDDIPRLFERFHRADATRGRSFEGSGIGLSLVRELAELHGGSVELRSAVDRGTSATVRVPLGSAHLDRSQIEPSPAPTVGADAYAAEALQWVEARDHASVTDGGDARPLILVVDDNADMRRYLHRTLSPRWRVTTAARGEEALDTARRHRPDLIVTDVMMPSIDGFEVIAAVRADPSLADVPVIVVSARAGDDAAAEGLANGADDYLVKPFSAPELIERVGANLRSAERASVANQLVDYHEQRGRIFNTLSSRLAEATTISETLSALEETGALLDNGTASLAILDRRSAVIRLHHSGPLPADILERNHNQSADDDMPYAVAVRTNETVRVEDWRHETRFPSIAADSIRAGYLSGLAVPLRDVAGDAFGAVGFAWIAPRTFTDQEIADVDEIAGMTARTIERILHTQRDHEIATALQDELLDVELRSTAAVASTRYVASTEMLRVGGDWYTATGLGDGSIAVSVGDVVGTGVRAAAVMSQLRSALSAAALADRDPAAVLDIVNRHAGSIQSADGTTAAYAVIDPQRRLVSYACAGHPYPILVEPNGDARLLEDGRGGPLGIDDTTTYSAGTCTFEPGSLLLLYTDGLIERRDEPLECGLERLRAHADAYVRLPSNMASDSIIGALTPPNGYSDDIAIVAVRLTGTTPTSFVDAIEARPEHYVEGRHRLRAWLVALETDPQVLHDVLVAVGEAVMNAIEHGGRELAVHHVVSTEAFVDEGRLVVTVNDCGQWDGDTTRSRRLDTRGRGLTLMYGLMDHVAIHRSRHGTQVVITHRLDREGLAR